MNSIIVTFAQTDVGTDNRVNGRQNAKSQPPNEQWAWKEQQTNAVRQALYGKTGNRTLLNNIYGEGNCGVSGG